MNVCDHSLTIIRLKRSEPVIKRSKTLKERSGTIMERLNLSSKKCLKTK
jgi:hypothetical protein